MKRTIAAALAAASVGGTFLIAAPAFASLNPTLTVKPSQTHNGTAVAITAECRNKNSFVTVSSAALGFSKSGGKGEELSVQLDLKSDVKPGTYTITGQCTRPTGAPGGTNTAMLKITYQKPTNPPAPIKPIPGFKPDVIVETGFGGMARFVANHHPAGLSTVR
jgi:hypothetical protein